MRLEDSAVGRTHDVAFVGAKKLVIDPIESDAGMRTTINVSKKISIEIDEHTLQFPLTAAQREFLA